MDRLEQFSQKISDLYQLLESIVENIKTDLVSMEDLDKIITGKICPYCACGTKLVVGDEVYPHLANKETRPAFLDEKFYMCLLDKSHYVGTYKDNMSSLGRLGNSQLRTLKHQGHKIFDPLWKTGKFFKSQRQAYLWLSEKMELPIALTHFGMFTVEQCKTAIEHCKELNGNAI